MDRPTIISAQILIPPNKISNSCILAKIRPNLSESLNYEDLSNCCWKHFFFIFIIYLSFFKNTRMWRALICNQIFTEKMTIMLSFSSPFNLKSFEKFEWTQKKMKTKETKVKIWLSHFKCWVQMLKWYSLLLYIAVRAFSTTHCPHLIHKW